MFQVNTLFANKKGEVFGLQLQNAQGKIANYTYEYIIKTNSWNTLQLINAVKDSRGFVRGKGAELPVKSLIYPLYHASHKGIQGQIRPVSAENRKTSDFGAGFYVGDKKEQGRQLIVDDVAGKLYTLGADVTSLNLYTFTREKTVLWALFVGWHRGYIDLKAYPKLQQEFAKLKNSDILVGLIADDKMHSVFPSFLAAEVTDMLLCEALKCVQYGNQYVFKTQKACNQIYMFDKATSLTEHEKSIVRRNKQKVLSTINEQVGSLKKMYRRQGRYIDEILEAYK